MIEIRTAVVGVLETNCYLAYDPATMKGFFVDPGSDPEYLSQYAESLGFLPEAILLTHGHFDHTMAVKQLAERFSIPYYVSENERELMRDPQMNMSYAHCGAYGLKADRLLRDGDRLSLAGFSIEVIATPGHTAGSASYYLPEEKLLFSGDTLFRGTFGTTKLPTGSFSQIVSSIRDTLFLLPDDVNVLPGHSAPTTIGREKAENPLRHRTFS